MQINAHLPTEKLKPFILTYIIVESDEELVNRVLPDTSLVLALRYKGYLSSETGNCKSNLPSSSLSGLRMSPRLFNYSKNTGNILVLFKEAAASAFFKIPLHSLYDDCVSLDNFISQDRARKIEEQLAEAKTDSQRINLIEQFLLTALINQKQDNLVLAAILKIHITKGLIKIKELANNFYISQDAFEKRFRSIVGTSPKQFSSLVRLKSITEGLYQNQKLAELAFNAGYFDQSHFNKDFKLFTGQTPTDFFNHSSFLQITDFLQ